MSFGTGFGSTGGFGASQPQQQAVAPSFGAPAPNTGFSFGAPATNPAPSSLFASVNPQPQAAQPNFGFGTAMAAPAAAPNPGFSFGAPAATANPVPGFGAAVPAATPLQSTLMGFGSSAGTTAPTPSFTSNLPTATATGLQGFGTGGLSFNTGMTANTAQQKPLGLSFGTPAPTAAATTSTGFSLGAVAPTPATGFSLGGTSTAAPTLGLSFGTTATAAPVGLSFGTATTASTGLGSSFGLGLGLGTSTAPSTGLSFGGFGTSATSTASITAAPAPAPVGLGGIATTTPSSTLTATKTEQAPKEQHLPNEIQQTVDNFKNFVKQQKTYSSDVARSSVKEFRKVETDIDGLNNMLNEVEKQLQLNRNIAEKLKYDTAKGLQQVEMAQRTYDTPIGLQYENTAPLHYFIELSDHFEREMQNMRLQIEGTDRYIKDNGKSAPLTHQDLIMGMRRIHEIFVSLAGHLQALHTQVESQKEQYLNFRKYMLNDSTNVFESSNKETEHTMNQIRNFTLKQPPVLASGPTPFGNVAHPSVVQAAQLGQPQPAFQSTGNFGGFSSGFGSSNTGMFGSPSAFGSSNFGLGSSTGFQLQKPPTKRGKQ